MNAKCRVMNGECTMRRWAVSLCLCSVLVSGAVAQEEEEFKLPQRPDNAAINYLLAAAQLERPWAAEEALRWSPTGAIGTRNFREGNVVICF